MRIEGLEFERSWPTHIAISECKEIAIKACHFRDGTFAVGAKGRKTYGITIEKCTWLQDREPGRMWKEIPWWRIHGAKGDGYPPVDVQEDWHLFDGDFFRADEIKGGVTIRHCEIGQVFNCIHLFNDAKKPAYPPT